MFSKILIKPGNAQNEIVSGGAKLSLMLPRVRSVGNRLALYLVGARLGAVTTAASNPFDQDAEIGLLTIVGGWGFDVKKEQGDIMSVYTIMNRKVVLNGASLPVATAMEVEVEQI